jgi:hypothetical protein
VISVSPQGQELKVEAAGIEPATLCLQGSDPFQRHPRNKTVPPSGIEPAPSGLQPDAQTTYAREAVQRSPWESNPPSSVGQTDRLTRSAGEQGISEAETEAETETETGVGRWGDGRESNPQPRGPQPRAPPLSYHHQKSALEDELPSLAREASDAPVGAGEPRSLADQASVLPLDEGRAWGPGDWNRTSMVSAPNGVASQWPTPG